MQLLKKRKIIKVLFYSVLIFIVLIGALAIFIKVQPGNLTSNQLNTISKANNGDRVALKMLVSDSSKGAVYSQLALADIAKNDAISALKILISDSGKGYRLALSEIAKNDAILAIQWYQKATISTTKNLLNRGQGGHFYTVANITNIFITISLLIALKFRKVFTADTNLIPHEHKEHKSSQSPPQPQPIFLRYKIAECFYVWGKIYEEGKFVKKDLKTALNYLEKAAKLEHQQADEEAKRIRRRLDIVSTTKSLPKQPNKPAGEAVKVPPLPLRKLEFPSIKYIQLKSFREWLSLADNNDVEAQCVVGIMYDDGIQISVSYDSAVHWYRKAEQQNSAEAQYRFGCMYDDGRGVNKSKKAAMEYFKKAAEQGHKKSQRRISMKT
jgi:hypothetical protein